MKKIKVNLQQVSNAEILTRQQLKNILGGDGSGETGSGECAKRTECCDTKGTPTINCCSGLVCGDGYCYVATV